MPATWQPLRRWLRAARVARRAARECNRLGANVPDPEGVGFGCFLQYSEPLPRQQRQTY
jgi:hypothetical protein